MHTINRTRTCAHALFSCAYVYRFVISAGLLMVMIVMTINLIMLICVCTYIVRLLYALVWPCSLWCWFGCKCGCYLSLYRCFPCYKWFSASVILLITVVWRCLHFLLFVSSCWSLVVDLVPLGYCCKLLLSMLLLLTVFANVADM
jgi:hypothetical protein